jgi:2,4-dienoyl-CoA reductase-like NADH-dependent reductase (Old Yellow Enzyme family)/thioredoxin reductase
MGNVSDQLVAYHEARAIGGVGLTILETMGVHPSSPGTIWGFHPDLPNSYPRMMDRLHAHGMKLFQQIWHGGPNANPLDNSAPWAPSEQVGPLNPVLPLAMSKAQIAEITQAFIQTARNCEAWGADGVEVHGAHGYLLANFLCPATNLRDDEYGGPLENRARFLLEVLEGVRAEVSSKFAVCVRLSPDTIVGGLGPAELHEVTSWIERRGLADVIHISQGSYHALRKVVGGMHEPMGYELPDALQIRAGLKLPIIMVGRYRTLEEADALIRNGDCDMVAMNRATIADPDLVRKSLAGEPERVRPCIGCNQGCLGRESGGGLGCAVNAGAGKELQFGDAQLRPAATPKKVLVVGGGPAGLEAARVAALRGHQVTLVEAQPRLGGALNLASMAPTRAGVRDICVWLEEEVYRLGVDVRLSTYVEADDVAAYGAEAVIIATGAIPRLDGLQASNPGEPAIGMDQPHVISSNGLFEGERRELGRSAVVVDDVGHYEAVATAEHLLSKGLSVSYVTRHHAFAWRCDGFVMTDPALERLSRGDFRYYTRMRVTAVEPDGVLIAPTFTNQNSNNIEKLPADTVVFISLNQPNRELYDELKGRGVPVTAVGDSNTPRFLTFATLEGHKAGAEV